MPYFVCRLNAPRPGFGPDMTPDEQRLMGEHAACWGPHIERGSVAVFGPVADPKGFWGLAVVEAADEAEVRAITDSDPVITAGAGFAYDVLPMPMATVRPAPAATS